MNSLRWSYRTGFLAGFGVCSALIAFALYAQYVLMMMACPLCILQRLVFMVLGVAFLAGGLHAPCGYGRWFYVAWAVLVALIGVGVSIRHLWIQSLPVNAVPGCGASLGYMLETRINYGGIAGVLLQVLKGSGECTLVQPILGISMPWWALFWYVLLALWAVLTGLNPVKLRSQP